MREGYGISVRAVAKKMKVSPMLVSFCERGKRRISQKMARIFVEAIFATLKQPVPKLFDLNFQP